MGCHENSTPRPLPKLTLLKTPSLLRYSLLTIINNPVKRKLKKKKKKSPDRSRRLHFFGFSVLKPSRAEGLGGLRVGGRECGQEGAQGRSRLGIFPSPPGAARLGSQSPAGSSRSLGSSRDRPSRRAGSTRQAGSVFPKPAGNSRLRNRDEARGKSPRPQIPFFPPRVSQTRASLRSAPAPAAALTSAGARVGGGGVSAAHLARLGAAALRSERPSRGGGGGGGERHAPPGKPAGAQARVSGARRDRPHPLPRTQYRPRCSGSERAWMEIPGPTQRLSRLQDPGRPTLHLGNCGVGQSEASCAFSSWSLVVYRGAGS